MERRDYILRMIEQMGAALVAMRRRILAGRDTPDVMDHELTALAGRGGLDLALLRGFSVDTLHMLVAPTGEVEPGRCWLMAELLYLDGLQAELEERATDARESLEKAHFLYSLVAPAGGLLVGLPEADERRDDVVSRLERLSASPAAEPAPPDS